MDSPGGCSCGEPWCRELGWPHEWDPRWSDTCTLCGQAILGDSDEPTRQGSGYAHGRCVDLAHVGTAV